MASAIEVYVEVGKKRVFAGAVDWPGWCRSGRDEDSALEALAEYGKRYKAALGAAARGFILPKPSAPLDVVSRLKGDATTDFGAPGAVGAFDRAPLDEQETKRHLKLLRASWAAFDRAAEDATGVRLRTGPRGGGRNRQKMIDHVLDADKAYLSRVGGAPDQAAATAADAIREGFVHAVEVRAGGGRAPKPRRSGTLWPVRYAVRRSAWHALDHAWEIEDRSER